MIFQGIYLVSLYSFASSLASHEIIAYSVTLDGSGGGAGGCGLCY